MRLTHDCRPWDVITKNNVQTSLPYRAHLSLFSGCGGFDLGFHAAGFSTVFANDINGDAASTYKFNIGDISTADVRDLDLSQLGGKIDVLSAGFPCQPFSNAGTRKGVEDGRGTLYQTAVKIVRQTNPLVVVFENVRGILSFRDQGKLLIHDICDRLDEIGYDVTYRLIDASLHNVPQRRLRLFIVGTRKGCGLGRFAFPRGVLRTGLTLGETILDLTDDTANQNELMQLNPQAIIIGAMVPEGGSWKDIPYENLPERLKVIADNMKKYRWPNFYRRYHRDEIAGTITAAFKPENAGVWHPIEQRIMSVREVSRIQTFPDWFEVRGKSIKSKYQQIGNAVPPRLAYELGLQIRSVLEGIDLREEIPYKQFEEFLTLNRPLRASDCDIVYQPTELRSV